MPFPASLLANLGLSGPAKLISAVSTGDGVPFDDSVLTVLIWENVTQNDPIYDTETGVFTIQESGLYALSVSMLLAPITEPVASALNYSGVILFVNESDVAQRIPIQYNEGQALFIGSGVLLISLNQGDEMFLTGYIACPDGTATGSSFSFNKVNLFKL